MRQAPAIERYEQPYTTQLAMMEPIYLFLILSKSFKEQSGIWLLSLPGAVVQTGQCSTPFGMGHFADIARGRHATKTHPEAKNKPTAQEHSMSSGGCLYACPNDNQKWANEHACATSKIIVCRACKKDRADRANIVHGEDKTGARTIDSPSIWLAKRSDTMCSVSSDDLLTYGNIYGKSPYHSGHPSRSHRSHWGSHKDRHIKVPDRGEALPKSRASTWSLRHLRQAGWIAVPTSWTSSRFTRDMSFVSVLVTMVVVLTDSMKVQHNQREVGSSELKRREDSCLERWEKMGPVHIYLSSRWAPHHCMFKANIISICSKSVQVWSYLPYPAFRFGCSPWLKQDWEPCMVRCRGSGGCLIEDLCWSSPASTRGGRDPPPRIPFPLRVGVSGMRNGNLDHVAWGLKRPVPRPLQSGRLLNLQYNDLHSFPGVSFAITALTLSYQLPELSGPGLISIYLVENFLHR